MILRLITFVNHDMCRLSGISGEDIFDSEAMTNYRVYYQDRDEALELSIERRTLLHKLVNDVVKYAREKVVAPANSADNITTAALDIVPEMFIVERSLFE